MKDTDKYEPLTIDALNKIVDHLRSIIPAKPLEEIYLTQEEWNALCNNLPVHIDDQSFPSGRHRVRIVTAEEREVILMLKRRGYDPTQR